MRRDEVERRLAGLEVRDVEAEAAEVLAEERAEGARLVGDRGQAAARDARRRPAAARTVGQRMHAAGGARLEHHLVLAARAGHADRGQ